MTKDDIIRMEKDATTTRFNEDGAGFHTFDRTKFANLVAAHEREACAKLVEPDFEHKGFPNEYLGGEDGVELLDCIAAKIRQRSQS
jgi:hypothetical protein